MRKEKFEKMCRAGGLVPIHREPCHLGEIFVADGFRRDPFPAWRRIGVESQEEFPMGAYCTFWAIATDDGNLEGASPILFDPDHACTTEGGIEAKGFDKSTMRKARLHVALQNAADFLIHREMVRLERPWLNALRH